MDINKAKARLQEAREEATLREYDIINAETDDFPGNYPEFDDSWDFEKFVQNFEVHVKRREENELEFDLIGLSPSLVNAFRRILIAEVPTIAVDQVHIYNNTTIFQDEFLAHRLGLIPFKVDPRFFENKQEGEEPTQQDTLVFELKVKCTKDLDAPKETSNPDELYLNRRVLTKSLKWIPLGNQSEIFETPIGPVEDDILIAKMSPGQELDIKLFCVKGTGRDHTKWSPVATASYRLLPKIELLREVVDDEAETLQKCFSEGVIKVVASESGQRVAKVADARLDTCSRNVFRYEELKDAVRLSLVKDHFIFTIESTGALPPKQLMEEAIEILISKCRSFLTELEQIEV